jgi:phenylacetate-CoA ligase
MNIAFLRRQLFEPLYFDLKNRSPRLPYWKELEKTQYLSEQELRDRQWQRLKSMLEYAYQNNTFYRRRFDEAGINIQDIQTTADIVFLPILSKKEIREHTLEMISGGFKTRDLLKFKTGGSTGKALDIYLTEECSEMRNACTRRHDRWTGWEVGEPKGAVWGNPVLSKDAISKLKKIFISPAIYLDTMNVTDSSVIRFAEDWKMQKPTLLYGHAHSLFILAEYVRRLAIDHIKPKGILSTSMMLMPHERLTIEEVFRRKVTDRYGCEEVSLIASECECHEGMHLNIEHLIIEFIKDDGAPTLPGEMGRIIVTDLMNRAMPFIRYQVEDLGVYTERKCSCGRGLPLMEKVVGRTADFLIGKDGSRVAGVSLIENTLTKIPGIDQMQIIQETLTKILINIVRGNGYTTESEQMLKSFLNRIFGEEMMIYFNYVESIQPEKSGKYRFSICNVNKGI